MEKDLKKNLSKSFSERVLRNSNVDLSVLKKYKSYAKVFAEIHNGIAVLSDLTANWSYTYFGAIAEKLHVPSNEKKLEINSIWEDFLLERVYPDDLVVKHALELQFLDLVKNVDVEDRFHYQANSILRVEGKDGAGMISKSIAVKLGLSINTVNRHRQNILQKLRVRNSHEAVSVFNRLFQEENEAI